MSDPHDPGDGRAGPGAEGPPGPVPSGGGAGHDGPGPEPSAAQPDGDVSPASDTVDLAAMDPHELVAEVGRMARQRDELREVLQHTQADFENYRKRVLKQQADAAERTAASIVEQLLAVLDACDGAIRHEATEVEPIYAALLGTLEKCGLERIDPGGEGFDPNRHDAVMHEPAEDGQAEPIVSDVMRPGYAWKGRVIRPAMVKVRG